AEPLDIIADRFSKLSMGSSGILFLTGGHLAGTRYTFETLTGTTDGHLVLGMLGLWFMMTGILHVGSSKLDDGTQKVREPAENGLLWFRI
ncbi:MAG: hypothetical protein SXQ77_05155, partial [Halobacteria archaeon]|nr:hypothetical protein [Halobacteria archaeon]